MAYIKMMQEKNKNVGFDTHVIQIGLDVNQDNGNKDIWENWRKKRKKEKSGQTKSLSHHHMMFMIQGFTLAQKKEDGILMRIL